MRAEGGNGTFFEICTRVTLYSTTVASCTTVTFRPSNKFKANSPSNKKAYYCMPIRSSAEPAETIMHRFLSHLCGGEKYVRDDVEVVRDNTSVKSIIKPSKWQTRPYNNMGGQEEISAKQVQRSIGTRTGFADLIPCYSTKKWSGRSVHYGEKDTIIPYEEDDDSYSDDSTQLVSFFSDHDDNYLHNLVADYLKSRLIHLHSRTTPPLSYKEGNDGNAASPSLKQALFMDDEVGKTCSTSHSEEDVSSCPSTASSVSFDSREKYFLHNVQNNDCLSVISTVEPSPNFTERYSFLKDASISIEYPLKFDEDQIESIRRLDDEYSHFNTISPDKNSNTSFLSNTDTMDLSTEPLCNERYVFSTTFTQVNDKSLDDSIYSLSTPNDCINFISMDSPEESCVAAGLPKIPQKGENKEDVRQIKPVIFPHEAIFNSNRPILSPFNLNPLKNSQHFISVNLDNKFKSEDNYSREEKEANIEMDSNGCEHSLSADGQLGFQNIVENETLGEGTRDILKELAQIRSSLNASELLGPLHRVKQMSKKSLQIY